MTSITKSDARLGAAIKNNQQLHPLNMHDTKAQCCLLNNTHNTRQAHLLRLRLRQILNTIYVSWPTSQILISPWPTRLGEYTHSTSDEARNYLPILTKKLDTQLSLTDKAWRIHPFRDRWGQKLSMYPDQWGRYSSLLDRWGLENTPILWSMRPEIIYLSWSTRLGTQLFLTDEVGRILSFDDRQGRKHHVLTDKVGSFSSRPTRLNF
jgi:hypothetical protein